MKKNLIKILSVVLVLVVAVSCIVAFTACNKRDNREVLTMYTESGFAPYEFVGSTNQIIGIDVAIMSQVAENLGMRLSVKDVKFDNITTFVKESNSNAVGAAGITINAERALAVDFSKVYASSTIVIVSKTPITSLSELAGKKVGVQTGTSGDLIATAAATNGYTYENDGTPVTVKAPGMAITQMPKYATLKTYLENDTIDAIVMDKLPAESLVGTSTGLSLNVASDLLEEDFGIALKKGDTKLMAAVNQVISDWLANGNMQQYSDYYTALDLYEKGQGAKPVAPEGLKLSWNC